MGHMRLHADDDKIPRLVIVTNGLLDKIKNVEPFKGFVGSSWDSKPVAISASPDAYKALSIYANSASTRTE